MSRTPLISIEYDGEYPTLCQGELTVVVDDYAWYFQEDCLISGGSYFTRKGIPYTTKGNWGITEWPDDFPSKYRALVLSVLNEVLPKGCCGGCVNG